MKYIINLFALIGLCGSFTAGLIYAGYKIYQPPCGPIAVFFSKECK